MSTEKKWFVIPVMFKKVSLSDIENGKQVWFSWPPQPDYIHGPFTKMGKNIVNSSNVEIEGNLLSAYQFWVPVSQEEK